MTTRGSWDCTLMMQHVCHLFCYSVFPTCSCIPSCHVTKGRLKCRLSSTELYYGSLTKVLEAFFSHYSSCIYRSRGSVLLQDKVVIQQIYLHLFCNGSMIVTFYYPLCSIFDQYRGTYRAGYILFVYKCASIPWIISFNNFRVFTNMADTLWPTNMYYISLDRSSYSTSAHICYIKIHAEMTEIWQVKDCSCYIHWCPFFFDILFYILSLNIHII